MNKTFLSDSIIQVDDELIVVLEKPLHDAAKPPFIVNHQMMLAYDIYPPGRDYKKIIATIGKRIEGVPLIVLEDDAWKKAFKKRYPAYRQEGTGILIEGFEEGFKAAQGRWTPEQLREGARLAWFESKENEELFADFWDRMNYHLQLLRKKVPTSITLKYISYPAPGEGDLNHNTKWQDKLAVLPDDHGGIIHPVSVSYENTL